MKVSDAINAHFIKVGEMRRQEKLPKPLRLLFVDDDPICLQAMHHICVLYGHADTLLNNAEQALTIVRGDPHGFDMAFLDVRLPRMSGIDLMRQLRMVAPDLPVVFLTAYPNLAELLRSDDNDGYLGFLSKPTGVEELNEVLRKHKLVPPTTVAPGAAPVPGVTGPVPTQVIKVQSSK